MKQDNNRSGSHNNNPQGHNQYTKDNQKSASSRSSQSDGRKGNVNNPEGHNQYTKNDNR